MKVTLRDIAKKVKLSPSTVSRALNDQGNVDEETRLLVRKTAGELGYTFDNLRGKSQRNVLLLRRLKVSKHQATSGVLSRDDTLALGAQEVLDRDGLVTRIQHINDDEENGWSKGGIDGAILIGGLIRPDLIRKLTSASIPVVVAGAGVSSVEVNHVTADYLSGTENAVDYLVGKGHRRICLVNGPETTRSSEEKRKGFRLGLLQHDLSFTGDQIVQSDFDADSGYEQTQSLLERFPDLDAVIYAADDIAMGGVHALKETGRRIPDDVAVIGYYDHGLARFVDPPLTSVAADLKEIGRVAATRLQMLLEQPTQSYWRIVLPTRLITRISA